MKKVFLIILAGTVFSLGSYFIDQSNSSKVAIEKQGQGGFDFRNPESRFDATKLNTNQTTITWRVVYNVQAACEQESRKLGNGGFGYAVDACSFWTGNACTIITNRKATMHELGHETLHCFQGSFHP